MKRVDCSCDSCDARSQSEQYGESEVPVRRRKVEVEDDHEGVMFCSITCAVYGGRMTLKGDQKLLDMKWKARDNGDCFIENKKILG